MVHTFPIQSGSQTISWDGKGLTGSALPEGKYRFVVRTTAKRDRVRDTETVVLDVTPPEVTYEILRSPSGRKTDRLKIVVKDSLSGVDFSKTVVTPVNSEITEGVPTVLGLLSNQESNKKQVQFYELAYPIILDTQNGSGDGGFSIASEDGSTSSNDEEKKFADGFFADKAGVPFQLAMGIDLNRIKLTGDCSIRLNNKKAYWAIKNVFDLDLRNRDVTLSLAYGGEAFKKQPQAAAFTYNDIGVVSIEGVSVPGNRWTIDNVGNAGKYAWLEKPDVELKRVEAGLKLDQESATIPYFTLTEDSKTQVSMYRHAKTRNPGLKTPYIDALGLNTGNYALALNTSVLADHIKTKGHRELRFTFGEGEITLRFHLKNNRWEKIECIQG